MNKVLNSIHMEYHDSSANSHKEYDVELVEEGAGCIVRFKYGRIGGTTIEDVKTPRPVNHIKAYEIFEKLVESKLKKGYEEV